MPQTASTCCLLGKPKVPLRRGKTEFFEEGGETHPIRDSPGYDPEVEQMQKEERHHQARERHYAGVKRGRSEVHRPAWAVGMTDAQVRQIARTAGQNPETEGWAERAGLYKGMGEMQDVREGGHRGEQRRQAHEYAPSERRGLRRGGKSKQQLRVEAGKAGRGEYDLPF